MTSRPFLAVAHYDGAKFVGWQRQPSGRTVQGEFEAVLERLMGRRTTATGAGRTDAGVHAVGQGIGFTATARWACDPDGLRRAVNALLAPEIWVERLHVMQPGFHARRSAVARRYRYVIGTDDGGRSPFRRPYEWSLGRSLDLARLEEAAQALPGEHDFRALARAGTTPHAHHRCRVALARWTAQGDGTGVTFTIEADRFLHRMVRFLVGEMVDIGLGRREAADLPRLLDSPAGVPVAPPAPPHGLYLEAVRYPPHLYAEASS